MLTIESLVREFLPHLRHALREGDDAHGAHNEKLPIRGAWGYCVPNANLVAVPTAKIGGPPLGGDCTARNVVNGWLDGPGGVSISFRVLAPPPWPGPGPVPATWGVYDPTTQVEAQITSPRNSATPPDRLVRVPPWGICVPANASNITAQLFLVNANPGLNIMPVIGISRGAPTREWVPDDNTPYTLTAGSTLQLTPPAWARRVLILLTGVGTSLVLPDGSLVAPVPLSVAGQSVILSAPLVAAPFGIAAGPGPASPVTIDVQWELIAA